MSGLWGFDEETDDALRASAAEMRPADQYVPATWGRRVGAYLIDLLVLMVALLVAATGFAVDDAAGAALIAVSLVAVLFAYPVFFEGGKSGQTPGKRAVGIRVRDDEGRHAGYGKAIVRTLVARALGLIPFAGLIDYLWPLWDDRNQCLHDKAASTIVVRSWAGAA